MARTNEEVVLARRVARILRNGSCFKIRFKVDGLFIQTYQYVYIAGAAEDDTVKVRIGTPGPYDAQYDPAANRMTFSSGDVGTTPDGEVSIVHESTHAVLDATYGGRGSSDRAQASFESGELAAYIAETLYAIDRGFPVNRQGPFAGPIFRLATKVKEHNEKNPAGPSFDCTSPDAEVAKGWIGVIYRGRNRLPANASLGMSLMNGIGDGP
jgi:hypothetical protein